jgi:chemotaxis protein MotB
MARKKRHKEEEHIDETWLIPYADMLTLLLALFIVLFAMSSVDVDKFKMLSQSLNMALNGGNGVLEYQDVKLNDIPNSFDREFDRSMFDLENKDMEQLEEIQKNINEYIEQRSLQDQLKTELSDEGLLIVIMDDALFDSGSAIVKEGSKRLAYEISEILATDPPRDIIISGHTDNVPINNAQFSSNWHLSVMRAVNFMRVILEKESLDPEKLSVKGYGEFRPVAPNDAAEGRAKNRRVELLIQPLEEK